MYLIPLSQCADLQLANGLFCFSFQLFLKKNRQTWLEMCFCVFGLVLLVFQEVYECC